MLETLIIGCAFSYIAVKAARWWVDWDCRRSNTPEHRALLIRQQMQLERLNTPARGPSPDQSESSKTY
jgi:hypothetical protein